MQTDDLDVLIVGAGISGIAMGCRLRMAHPDRTFAILEGREAIGGTWDLFRYPGVRSDSDMYTFGFSFRPWTDPQSIAPGAAILRYLNETIDAYDLRRTIRFSHRATHFAWCSTEKRWTITATAPEGIKTLRCRFLVTCTGYYNYEKGYTPDLPGLDTFTGDVVHPQHWPEDLETAGQRIVVIGSGATAVTLVPALAETAAHVTMLQRSPTYILSRPSIDPTANALSRLFPKRVAHRLNRLRNIGLHALLYGLSRRSPDRIRAKIRDEARAALGPDFDLSHFTPRYAPWDQRMCLIPDGDLFAALRSGRASVVTDTIEAIVPTGVRTTSGALIEADILVTATGLNLQFLGGATLSVEGRTIHSGTALNYRGMMYADIPNWVAIIGYTAASWTLKADLTADYVCRLLHYMDDHGYQTVVPHTDEEMPTEVIMAKLKGAGYVQRSADVLPRQGMQTPWRNEDSYLRDSWTIRRARFDDGVLQFG